jgi:prolyl oligopeptidase
VRIATALLIFLLSSNVAIAQDDPYLWLEDVMGDKAIAWAKEQNVASLAVLEAKPGFKALHERLLAVYNSRERIPSEYNGRERRNPQVKKRGAHYYVFWQDAANPRGLWRRTSLAEFKKKDPAWEVVLDLDKLSAAENEKWVFKGAECLAPRNERCLVMLSRLGADAVVVREFDLVAKAFVKGGFETPESKQQISWSGPDAIYIATDFGPGTMTSSGYARIVKEWKRGTPLAQARTVFEAGEKDVGAGPWTVDEKGRRYAFVQHMVDFWTREQHVRRGDAWKRVETPADATVNVVHGMLYVRLAKEWKPGATSYPAGALIATDFEKFLAGERVFDVVFAPGPRVALQDFTVTKTTVLLDVLDNVRGRVVEARRVNGQWTHRDVAVPTAAAIATDAVDNDEGDDYWMTVASFLEPTTLYLGKAGTDKREKLKSLPTFFDAKGLKVVQHEATSKDGTKIPYFLVAREDVKLDGTNPTILYGYGGFEIAMKPSYSGAIGAGWLEKGGVWALSNIRGGGEFGPEWHTTALREGRAKTHDDFIAIAEDLIRRKVTSPRHLGIMGGSQGGLLVGAAFTQRPDLFRAVACAVPLLDMKRFHKLLAGASWVGEYGNPDIPGDWKFISTYSPYQNVSKDRKYPRVFFTTSTRDDRVHPGHARKMVARMKEQGHDVLYFEYMEGGHAAGANPSQQAYTWALIYTFLQEELR